MNSMMTLGFVFMLNVNPVAAATTIENDESGKWVFKDCLQVSGGSGGNMHTTLNKHAWMQVSFYGSSVELYCKKDSGCGWIEVYIDDRYIGEVNTYSASAQWQVKVFEKSGLRLTDHKLRIIQKGPAGAAKVDYVVVGDHNFGVSPPTATVPSVSYPSPSPSVFSGLTVLENDAYPHTFHFRKSEADAIAMESDYNGWESIYDGLMGIIGKVYNEEDSLAAGPNFNFPVRSHFKQFKIDHPDQLVLLHFDGVVRDMRSERATDYYSPQHFLYYVPQPGYSSLSSTDTESVIQTSNPVWKYFKMNIGIYADDHEDVVLVRKAADGSLDWSVYEYTTLVDHNGDSSGNRIRVERGVYGTTKRSWNANSYYLCVPVNLGPWGQGDHFNNLWVYNFSLDCPTDRAGKTCADVFAEELQDCLVNSTAWNVNEFDGVEFDIMHTEIQHIATVGRSIDSDGDRVADFGYDGEVNRFGCGLYYLGKQLRAHLGNDKLILGDSSNVYQQRCFSLFNGMENEGFSHVDDFNADGWTTALNRLRFWNSHAYLPAFSYVNWKFKDGNVWTNLPQNVARLNLATLSAYDVTTSFFGYKGMGVPTDIHDEAVAGTDQTIGWLGAPLGNVVCLASQGNDLLNGEGVSISSAFINKIELVGDSLQKSKAGNSLKVSSSNDGRIIFRIKDIDVSSLPHPELTLMAEFLSNKTGYLPDEMHRQFIARVLDENYHVIEEYSMFAKDDLFFSNIIYFRNLGSANKVHIEFEFEGCGYVRMRYARLWDREPSFYREFDGGFVAGNPSDHSVDISLPIPCYKLTAQADTAKADYDQTVNDGSVVSNSITLGARDGIFLK